MDIDEIYRAYFAQVYRYTLLLTRDQAEAEDVTQETFFKAICHIDGFRGETDIRIWLCHITKNIFLDRKRKQKRTVPLDQADEIPAAHDPERDIVLKDSASYAMEVLARLPEVYRTVFTMRTLEDASYTDIGRKLGKSENWARVTYYRAKCRLQEEMKHEGFM